jgi:hypothetical protein
MREWQQLSRLLPFSKAAIRLTALTDREQIIDERKNTG